MVHSALVGIDEADKSRLTLELADLTDTGIAEAAESDWPDHWSGSMGAQLRAPSARLRAAEANTLGTADTL